MKTNVLKAQHWLDDHFREGCGCCLGLVGNVNGDFAERVDLSDLSLLINYMIVPDVQLACPDEANLDGDPQNRVDLSDLSTLIGYLVGSGLDLRTCP
jgi:hypothetical protein